MLLAIYIPKIQFQKNLRRKNLLNHSSAILRSAWNMSRVVCQPPKQRKKVLESSKSDHGLRYLKVDVVMGVKLTKKVAKRRQKRLQKGDKVAMIVNLATDKSWLASKTTNNMIDCQIFSPFWTFVTKYK